MQNAWLHLYPGVISLCWRVSSGFSGFLIPPKTMLIGTCLSDIKTGMSEGDVVRACVCECGALWQIGFSRKVNSHLAPWPAITHFGKINEWIYIKNCRFWRNTTSLLAIRSPLHQRAVKGNEENQRSIRKRITVGSKGENSDHSSLLNCRTVALFGPAEAPKVCVLWNATHSRTPWTIQRARKPCSLASDANRHQVAYPTICVPNRSQTFSSLPAHVYCLHSYDFVLKCEEKETFRAIFCILTQWILQNAPVVLLFSFFIITVTASQK